MASRPALSNGFCERAFGGIDGSDVDAAAAALQERPTLQLVSFKAPGPSGLRIAQLSDGFHSFPAVFVSSLNHMFSGSPGAGSAPLKGGLLQEGSVICVTNHSVMTQPKSLSRFLLVQGIDIIGHQPILGNPLKFLPSPGSADQPAATPSTSAPPLAPTPGRAPETPSRRLSAMSVRSPGQADSKLPADVPVMSLNPYLRQWTIRVRVMAVDPLRSFSNDRGSGFVFSAEVADASGSIRVAAFNDVAETISKQLVVGQSVILSRGMVQVPRLARPIIGTESRYEIRLDSRALIDPCDPVDGPPGSDTHIAGPTTAQVFAERVWTPINALSGFGTGHIVDLLAVITDIRPPVAVMANGEMVLRRMVQVADPSGVSCAVTFWRDHALELSRIIGDVPHGVADPSEVVRMHQPVAEPPLAEDVASTFSRPLGVGSVLGVRSLRLVEYQGTYSLSSMQHSTRLFRMGADAHTEPLARWFLEDLGGPAGARQLRNISSLRDAAAAASSGEGSSSFGPGGGDARQLTNPIYLGQIQQKLQNLKPGDPAIFSTICLTPVRLMIQAPLTYPADENGNKVRPVLGATTGSIQWSSARTGALLDTFEHRFIIRLRMADASGNIFVNAFAAQAEPIMGMTAEEYFNLRFGPNVGMRDRRSTPTVAAIDPEADFEADLEAAFEANLEANLEADLKADPKPGPGSESGPGADVKTEHADSGSPAVEHPAVALLRSTTKLDGLLPEQAQQILDLTAEDLQDLVPAALAAHERVSFSRPLVARIRSRAEIYKEEVTIRHHLIAVRPVDFVQDARHLIQAIHTYLS
ncbi:hypothetical protein H696_02577 [Fonticula alba]|uniref:Replication factor A C-terminal domain-containing protein n=1 Tax=Fonticula alba TaxID=691883 RepID=A0A058Z9N7_FONAL|nr:hypothetical protein H696_02577 [Fonticula alba]KCV70247.1 hypothetical protein H696_02577 [Fonticula alba]|eukprot:XP_009494763.1 hypothetical protein H696_02577 [Fonticula alba]